MRTYTSSIEKKTRFCKLFVVFLFSMTLNHEMFFISIGPISLRPYMLISFLGLFILAKSNSGIILKRYQIKILLYLLLFYIISLSTFIVSPYFLESPMSFFRKVILLFFQVYITFFIFTLTNNLTKNELLKSFYFVLKLMISISLVLYFYHLVTKGMTNYMESYLGVLYSYQGQPRLMGTIGDPNYFSLYLTTIYWLYVFFKKEVMSSLQPNLITSLAFAITIILTYSRTALIVNIMLFIIIFLKKTTKLNFKMLILVVVLSITFLIIWFTLNSSTLSTNELLYFNNDTSIENRLELFHEGIKNIKRYPFGVGIGYLENYYLDFLGVNLVAHNDFLSVFIEVGIFGSIMHFGIYLYAFIHTNFYGKLILMILFSYSFALTLYYFDPIIVLGLSLIIIFYKKEN